MIWVGIVGAKGYVGEALTRLIAAHPNAQVGSIVSSGQLAAGKDLATGGYLKKLQYNNMLAAFEKSDVIFKGTLGDTALDILPEAILKGKKIIDISEEGHGSLMEMAGSVYGLSRLYRDKVKDASVVINPSCFCTGAMLGLAPLFAAGAIYEGSVAIEAKAGITSLKAGDSLSGVEVLDEEGHRVYRLEGRYYSAEIEQQIKELFGINTHISYTSYINGVRGVVTTIYAQPTSALKSEEVVDIFKQFYGSGTFVNIHGGNMVSKEKGFAGLCDIEAAVDENSGRIVVTTVLDSVVKTVTGQAVQTMNLMCGFNEEAGLQYV